MPFRLVIFISISANSSQPHPCHHINNFSLKLQSPSWLPFCTISGQPGDINNNTHAGQQHSVCLSQKDLSFPCWCNYNFPKMQQTKIYEELKKKFSLIGSKTEKSTFKFPFLPISLAIYKKDHENCFCFPATQSKTKNTGPDHIELILQ